MIRCEVIIQGNSPRAHKPLRRDIDRVGRTLAPKKESKESQKQTVQRKNPNQVMKPALQSFLTAYFYYYDY